MFMDLYLCIGVCVYKAIKKKIKRSRNLRSKNQVGVVGGIGTQVELEEGKGEMM